MVKNIWNTSMLGWLSKNAWNVLWQTYEVKVTYEFYRAYFRRNYNLRIGKPQVDVRSMCELLKTKSKSATTDKDRL